jgi:hypothetical protein
MVGRILLLKFNYWPTRYIAYLSKFLFNILGSHYQRFYGTQEFTEVFIISLKELLYFIDHLELSALLFKPCAVAVN